MPSWSSRSINSDSSIDALLSRTCRVNACFTCASKEEASGALLLGAQFRILADLRLMLLCALERLEVLLCNRANARAAVVVGNG